MKEFGTRRKVYELTSWLLRQPVLAENCRQMYAMLFADFQYKAVQKLFNF